MFKNLSTSFMNDPLPELKGPAHVALQISEVKNSARPALRVTISIENEIKRLI